MEKKNWRRILSVTTALFLCAGGVQAGRAEGKSPAGERANKAWLNTDIDGSITEETTARIQDDFNLAANKEYILKLKIPAGKTQNGGFYEVGGIVEGLRVEAMKDESATGHDAELVKKYYGLLSDWETRDREGTAPAMKYINEIREISTLQEMTAWFADREKGGLFSFCLPSRVGGNFGCLFSLSIAVSRDDPSGRVLSVDPMGISLEDAAEYRNMTENGRIKNEAYTASRRFVLSRMGFTEEEAERMINNTFRLETMLSEHMLSVEELNDPANIRRIWNPMDFAGVCEAAGSFPAGEILKGWGLSEDVTFNLAEPEYMKALGSIYTEENLELFRDYTVVRMADEWCGYLDRETRDGATAAANKAKGIEGRAEDDVLAMQTTLRHLPVPLDNLYIRRNCTPELREEITGIIHDVVRIYRTMLEGETWLTEETRKKAVEKLDAMTVRSVYPDKLEAWDDLEFRDAGEGGNLLEATITADRYFRDRVLALLKQKVDKTVWNRYEMPVSDSNAYYSPEDNSINILAGILNGIVYQPEYTYEQKLGTVGVIIGHEISHAFDPSGSQYDKDGALKSWWTEEDKKAFEQRAAKLISYYDSIEPIEGMKYSGRLVQDEAVADLGGMKAVLLLAAEKKDFNYEEFFLAYGKFWAVKRLRSEEINKMKTDVHPLAYLRTNVTVMQFDEFQKQFGVQPGDGMYLAPEERISVW